MENRKTNKCGGWQNYTSEVNWELQDAVRPLPEPGPACSVMNDVSAYKEYKVNEENFHQAEEKHSR